MKNGYVMTMCMFPLLEKKEILKGIYFDNPQNIDEIKQVAEILRKANYSYSPFPETYKQFGKEYISLEFMKDKYYERYKNDKDIQTRKSENKYKNVYYHLAKNWVIVRIDDDIKKEEVKIELAKISSAIDEKNYKVVDTYKNYEDAIKFLDLLIFISLENDSFLNHSFLIPECFDIYSLGYESKSLKNLIIDLLVIATSKSKEKENPNDFRYCRFDKVYEKLKLYENLVIDKLDNELIQYVADNLEIYNQLYEDKMKIVSLVSMIELLIAHNPDSSRYNIEDSIRKQFSNKILVILHLNNMVDNPKELEKLLLLIYDLRSSIAHGSFNNINSICEKIYKWRKLYDNDFTDYENGWDEFGILNYINILLRKYFRVILRHYLSDKTLFDILKK